MLRVIERYNSYQGEGPNTGKPTMFVRFAGCNFKCPGWPCDTQYAIDPKLFIPRQRKVSVEDLADAILADPIENICFTGGEPFLQDLDDLHKLMERLTERDRFIEVFTNGSLPWTQPIVDIVDTFVVDWKLPGSGEFPDDEKFLPNIKLLGSYDAIKFTVKDRGDFERALFNYQNIILPIRSSERPQVWCGPVWDGGVSAEKLTQWMRNAEVPWNLNIQAHKYIFGAETVGV